MTRRATTLGAVMTALLLAAAGCDDSGGGGSGPGQGDAVPDSTGPDAVSDAADPDAGDATVPPPSTTCADDEVALTFAVDDTANRTYGPGELIWTGSFSWDEATHTVEYASSWLPDEGPFPPLFDDGPVGAGGHEPEGATAGDHVWSVVTCYRPEQDRLFSYGLLNGDFRWIWLGPNGQFEVTADATGRVDVPGMAIPAHGDRDLEVYLDLNALHEDWVGAITLDSHRVFIKGTMNSWTPVQLLDDGSRGDEVAGDGLLTYRHSLYLGPHDGLLQPGAEAQFVFVFAKGDADPDVAQEYKVDGDASPAGVSAAAKCAGGWTPHPVVQSMDSKGVELNTAVVVCPDDPDPECDADTPCPAGEVCEAGTCVPDTVTPECDADTPCPAGEVCEAGTCVPDTVTPECDGDNPCPAGEICQDGACVPDAAPECDGDTPCPAGEVCQDGTCVPDTAPECGPQDPCTAEGEICQEGVCILEPAGLELLLVTPDHGSSLGGTPVTLTGSGFVEGVAVLFGDAEATVQAVTPTSLEVLTAAHALGSVDVTVTAPDGGSATFPGAFTFVEAASAPVIDAVDPQSGPTGGGTVVTLTGQNFVSGAVVRFGSASAPAVEVASGGASLTATTPAAPIGSVDVTVENPDGQSDTAPGAFTYEPELPDWGRLDGPAEAGVADGESVTLTAQVYEPGVTEGDGAGFGLVAEVGYGPAGTDPTAGTGWTWAGATYSHEEGNNDVWTGTVQPPVGAWSATLRFSVSGGSSWLYVDLGGAVDGFDAADVASVTVAETLGTSISALVPAKASPVGTTQVTVQGTGLGADCDITVDGQLVATTWGDGPGPLSFTAPPHPPGSIEMVITCGAGYDSATLTYASTWDGVLDEWTDETLLATSSVASSWGEENSLGALHAASDGENLYLAVAGSAFGDPGIGANAIVVYVDADLGAGTGPSDFTAVTDQTGSVDDALASVLQVSAAGFGAEVAFATLNMDSYVPAVDDPAAVDAGWRGFAKLNDLAWILEGAVYATAEGVEAILPLSSLYAKSSGSERTLGIVVRVASASGDYLSNQSLPEGTAGDADTESTSAATFVLTY